MHKNMVKKLKIAIRNVRRDANDAIKKDKELPEDEQETNIRRITKINR